MMGVGRSPTEGTEVLAGFVRRRAVARGVFGGSTFWLTVAALIYGRRLGKRLFGDRPKTVFSERLQPGEALLISHERDAAIMEG